MGVAHPPRAHLFCLRRIMRQSIGNGSYFQTIKSHSESRRKILKILIISVFTPDIDV